MGLRIVQVDAFTDTPFAGNPAAVCVLPKPREGQWMQHVAREMNLSETAFCADAQMVLICAGLPRLSKFPSVAMPRWPVRTSSGRMAICRPVRLHVFTRAVAS